MGPVAAPSTVPYYLWDGSRRPADGMRANWRRSHSRRSVLVGLRTIDTAAHDPTRAGAVEYRSLWENSPLRRLSARWA